MRIIKNSAQCSKCGDVLVSENGYHLIECSCGSLAISGGFRRLERYGKEEDYEEKSIVEAECRKKV